MAKLVLTLVGDDRAGLVQAVADAVALHGGNWERSELAELAGAFAGIVLVSVPDAGRDALVADLDALEGLLEITPHTGIAAGDKAEAARFVFTVLGNDRPGTVRDITHALVRHGLSIDRFTSHTLDAPMAGGTLFEAKISVRVDDGADLAAATAELERLAGEIQVDLTVG
ncbi:MAG: glycine cleavage system protein R [Microbacterium sp.]|uniref:glycine cleavage system protein R n=1 Tax=Microbacterium sp. TaxID=51671 RepID=UPI003A87B0A6